MGVARIAQSRGITDIELPMLIAVMVLMMQIVAKCRLFPNATDQPSHVQLTTSSGALSSDMWWPELFGGPSAVVCVHQSLKTCLAVMAVLHASCSYFRLRGGRGVLSTGRRRKAAVCFECRSAKSAMGWRRVSLSTGYSASNSNGFICSFEHHHGLISSGKAPCLCFILDYDTLVSFGCKVQDDYDRAART